MTDCSSIQGSTSSSSDVMTLTTAASSWCAIPTNSRIRVLRLVRPHHTRRMLMVTGPESSPSYGFTVRGGKEFGTGFFVSQVERNSEADLKGLRIGDQILRLNGFRVEDAVHKEFIRFVSSQDRITLKVRGVGMLPIKDKESERLSWNVVKMHSISNTPSESSFKTVTTEHSSSCSAIGVGDLRCKDINVVLDVAPRTKLGLGICKGPEWKPGIFVQFTKEKSVAREAGLRPGDQILSVNSIDFSDVLFSEAVAVMKSSNKLEMIVRTAAGCDLFPGESSGYNSSASSVTGDQSPCWADAKSKRLTAVREEPTIAVCWNEALYAEQRCNGKLLQNRDTRSTSTVKEVNKTIIKLSENGTSINNTYIANPHLSSRLGASLKIANTVQQEGTLTKAAPIEPPSPPSTCLYSNVEQPGRSRHLQQELDTVRGNSNKILATNTHRNLQFSEEKHKQANTATLQRNISKTSTSTATATATATTTSNLSKTVGPPKAPPPAFYSNLTNKTSNNQNSTKSYNINEVPAAGSTLSSAITEELKKRKEKQRFSNNTNNSDNSTSNNNNFGNKSSNNRTEQQQTKTAMTTTSTVTMQRHQHHQHQHQHQHQHNQHYQHHAAQQHQQNHHQHQQQQQHQEHQQQAAIASPTKRAPNARAVSSNMANCSERNNTTCSNANSLDQHSLLMDEFKRAHQRMFKNGFHESERKERQEALNRTSMMEDDSSHRTSRHFPNEKSTMKDTGESQQQSNQQSIPPPPPQFANSPPKNPDNSNYGIYYQTMKRVNGATPSNSNLKQQSSTNAPKPPKPPNSPTPDYDNVDFRSGRQVQINDANANHNTKSPSSTASASASAGNTNTNRRTMRLGAVTIGEYEQQRKEPGKFEFVGNKNRDTSNGYNNARNIDNLQSELHDTLSRSKIKNGNHIEHQRDCPLRNGYANGNGVDQLTRKIQSVNLSQKQAHYNGDGTATIKKQGSATTNGTGTGILKNGSSRNGGNSNNGTNGHTAKIIEKTITFGN